MKLTKNQLREQKIHNPYNFADLQDEPKVWVGYQTVDNGRGGHGASWQVQRNEWATSPSDRYGHKSFSCRRETR